MRIIALGDTHGRDDWKKITANEDFDAVVFIGDYFDTHEGISPKRQAENFKDLLAYKGANRERVVLLLGNHDYHYLRAAGETYSGYQVTHAATFAQLLEAAIAEDLLQICFVHRQFLFTHAGVTKTWCRANNIDLTQIETAINTLFRQKPGAFKFTPGANCSPYGDDITQSPLWVRPDSLRIDAIAGYVQVVGHTTQRRLTVQPPVVLIDTLGTSGEYLSVTDGEVAIEKGGMGW